SVSRARKNARSKRRTRLFFENFLRRAAAHAAHQTRFFSSPWARCGHGLRSLPPQDEVAGSPTGFGARWWRDVGVLDLFPVLGIERLAITEHSLSRKVIEVHELIGERILIRRVMGDAVAGFPPFVGCHALRAVVERRSRQPKAFRYDF